MIRFACPGCGAVFTVADDKAGKTGKCPKCAAQFEIPAAVPPPPPPQQTVRLVSQSAPPPPPPPPPVQTPSAAVVEVACPGCRGQLAVNAADVSTTVECPFCKKVFVPNKPSAPPPAPPPPPTAISKPKTSRSLDDVLGSASKRSHDDDEDERPSRRRPRDDDDEDERPSRRRARSEDDDDDERPNRRRRDRDEEDEDDRPRRSRREEGSPAFAIVSLVTGILALVSLCCCVFVPPPLALVSVITGIIGLRSPGKGMAIGGILCSILALVLAVLFFFLGVGLNLLGNAVQQRQMQQQQQFQNPPFGDPRFR